MATASKAAGKLSPVPATALVTGNLIGSGIFLFPASLAPFGGLALLGWLFTSPGAILVALGHPHRCPAAKAATGRALISRLIQGARNRRV